jgi:hypothetical protein
MTDLDSLGITQRVAKALRAHKPPLRTLEDLIHFKDSGSHWSTIHGLGEVGAEELDRIVSRERKKLVAANPKHYERLAAYAFGVVFISAIFASAIFLKNPTPYQYQVFKIVLAIAAAGISSFIPGFLSITVKGFVRAGGALGVFVVVYFFSPAPLAVDDPTNESWPTKFDGRVGPIYFENQSLYEVEVSLFHPDNLGLFAAWEVSAERRERLVSPHSEDESFFGNDWGLQVGDSKIRSLGAAATWEDGYWEASTSRFFEN